MYDSIESTTSGLFTVSGTSKSIISICLSSVQKSFQLNLGYNSNISCISGLIDEKMIKEDLNAEQGIKLLDEYLIQSGNFSIKERVAFLYEIYQKEPERLSSLPNIISVAGMQAGIANIMIEIIFLMQRSGICIQTILSTKFKYIKHL